MIDIYTFLKKMRCIQTRLNWYLTPAPTQILTDHFWPSVLKPISYSSILSDAPYMYSGLTRHRSMRYLIIQGLTCLSSAWMRESIRGVMLSLVATSVSGVNRCWSTCAVRLISKNVLPGHTIVVFPHY
jgi:hypothetical protein